MKRRECGCLDRPGGCIHHWITIPMGGGFEEGDPYDELSPEAEAEHFLVVEKVARENGFPLSDWKPKPRSCGRMICPPTNDCRICD